MENGGLSENVGKRVNSKIKTSLSFEED